MAYCTVVDVQIYITTFIFDTESEPTLAQVTQMCEDVSDNVIDPIVSRHVELPVSNVVGLQYLQQWAVNCVLASVYRSIETEADLSVIFDGKCQDMKDAFLDDPGLVEDPFESNERGGAKGSTRPETNWKRNERQW